MDIVWSPRAARDLRHVGDYASENVAAAGRLVRQTIDRATSLDRHPRLGRPGRATGTRELVVTGTPFIVVYRIGDVAVEILAVLHGAQRWPETF